MLRSGRLLTGTFSTRFTELVGIHWTFLPHTDPDASLAFYRINELT
ncbi:hypothetical protein [Arthrobacter sp. CAN_A1]